MSDRKNREAEFLRELSDLRKKVLELEAENARHENTRGELRNLLSLHQAILNTIPDMVWLKDAESKFLGVNDAFAQTCGKTGQELVGKSDFDFWPHHLAQRYRDDDIAVMKSGVKKVIEETLVHSAEKQVWIETIKSPVCGEDGRVIGTVGISRDVTERKRAHERMQAELAVAAQIQKSMLQQKFPRRDQVSEFDLYALMHPAREVGGDLYDFFQIDSDRLCIAVGDVAGKGVGAALFMAITIALLRSTARQTSAPDMILNILNRELARGNDDCMFVTAFCGILDLRTGTFSYSNAGHNPPFASKKDRPFFRLSAASGPPLGIMEEMTYKQEHLMLDPGDALFTYTDGVTEASNKDEEFFSEDRLHQRLSDLKSLTCEQIVAGVMESITLFSGDFDQSDDVTMMALRFNGPQKD
jgi:PAS domain S-box-containing protein